jgi:hypothetical protein
MKTLSCPNKACLLASSRSIICYGFYNTNYRVRSDRTSPHPENR